MRRFVLFVILILLSGCLGQEKDTSPLVFREDLIPKNAVKITPETDLYPPILHSDEYEKPIPLPYPVNTKGAEDSAFVLPDGKTLYLFFTPDVKVPAEKQVLDGVTGIFVSERESGKWGEVKRVILQDRGKLALDGCAFVKENKMWFCTAREGYTGLHWFTAEFENGKWQNW